MDLTCKYYPKTKRTFSFCPRRTFLCIEQFPITTPLTRSIIEFISSRPTCWLGIFKTANLAAACISNRILRQNVSNKIPGKVIFGCDSKTLPDASPGSLLSLLDCSLFTVLHQQAAVPTDNIPRDGSANPSWSSLYVDLQPPQSSIQPPDQKDQKDQNITIKGSLRNIVPSLG